VTIKVIDPDPPAPPANAEELLAKVRGMFAAALEAPPVRSFHCPTCRAETRHTFASRAADGAVQWWACEGCGVRRCPRSEP
jgi:hypothetical protein